MYRRVENSSEYMLAFRGLGLGKHILNFNLGKSFFQKFSALEQTVGSLTAEITIDKGASFMKIHIKVAGVVKAVCDRCLGQLDLPIDGELDIVARESGRDEGNDDDFLVLSPDEDYIDLSDLIYQTYMLNYPIRVVHDEGECDEKMEELLDRYVVNDSEDKRTDPRWNELKKLINN